MKKTIEVTAIHGYNAFTGMRRVDYRDMVSGMNLIRFYLIHDKRNLVDKLRQEGMIVYHNLYRGYGRLN